MIEFVPITTLSPISTFGRTILLAGNQTFFPILTGPKSDGNPCVMSNQAPCVQIITSAPIPQLSPISIDSDGFNTVFSNIPTPFPILTFESIPLQPPLPTSTPCHINNQLSTSKLLQVIITLSPILQNLPNFIVPQSIVTFLPISTDGCISILSAFILTIFTPLTQQVDVVFYHYVNHILKRSFRLPSNLFPCFTRISP